MPVFDFTIHLSDLIWMLGILYAGIKVRDSFRDLALRVGTESPPTGLLGRVAKLEEKTDVHRTWLVVMREKLGFTSHHHQRET